MCKSYEIVLVSTAYGQNRLFSLAVTPEYVDPIRDEIHEVLAANDNTITTQALQQMVKLDSYMNEVLRFYPPGVSTYGSCSLTELVKLISHKHPSTDLL